MKEVKEWYTIAMLQNIHHKSQVVCEETRSEACPQTVKMDPCSAGLDMIIDRGILNYIAP